MTDHTYKVIYLTNIPVPYRERMHELLFGANGIDYAVIYCAESEPNRQWQYEKGEYKKIYLSNGSRTFIHNNLNVVKYLKQFDPDVIVSTGFSPTMIYAFFWCLVMRKKFIPSIDGTFRSETGLTFIHKLVRKFIFRYSGSFVAPSLGSMELFKSYSIPESRIFRSCLCIENASFSAHSDEEKKFELMFSGQLIEGKMPLFFVEVAKRIKEKIPDCKVLVIGDGPLREVVLNKLRESGISFEYAGFVQPHDLHHYYAKSRILLFPTRRDTWGVVANEACASGLPVITCKNAGVADDLIINDYNGYILPLEVNIWVEHTLKLLSDTVLYEKFSSNSIKAVCSFNAANACRGIIDAIQFCSNGEFVLSQ